jgi:glucose/mannose transport system permease protein
MMIRRLADRSLACLLMAAACAFLWPIFSIPHMLTFQAWSQAWSSTCTAGICHGISTGIWNSFAIVLPSLGLSLVLGSITGWALSLRAARRSDLLFALLLSGLFIPGQVALYPMIAALRWTALFGTRTGLIMVDTLWGLPLMTLLFRNFFAAVPRNMINAALIDGAGFFSIFLHIMLPASRSISAAALLLQFTFLWNEFLFALTFSSSGTEPVTVALHTLAGVQFHPDDYNLQMAAALISALPTITLYLAGGGALTRELGRQHG